MRELAHIQTLEQFSAAVRAFEGCGLKVGATQAVIGDGNPLSGVVLMGEAPGAEEDRLGKPFVGRSGKVLDKLMASIGLDRTNAYITNTVFWRPPDNRTPTQAEVAACRPLVDRHVALLKPKLLILVGGTAAKSMLGVDEPLGKLRGVWHAVPNPYVVEPIPALATFHPAYLLRNPPATEVALEDWRVVGEKIAQLAS